MAKDSGEEPPAKKEKVQKNYGKFNSFLLS